MKRFIVMLAACAAAQGADFAKDVAPILYQHCTECHRPGEAAPFSLLSYEDAAKRSRQIAAITAERTMPPWKAEPGTYSYRDERRLSDAEIAVLGEWARAGAPAGDLSAAPPVPSYTDGWKLGQPDLILEMPEGFRVPADGPNIYRNFVIRTGLSGDRWIAAVEYRPSARTVVHHALFSADTTGAASRADAADAAPGYSSMGLRGGVSLGGWAVGTQPHAYSDGLSMKLPAGADLVLQLHLVPDGSERLERSQIGLYFAKEPSRRTIVPAMLPPLFSAMEGVRIPAGERSYTVEDSFTLPVDCEVISVFGHAHYLGRELELRAKKGDGAPETLLRISDWDFAWQDKYVFAQPVRLSRGTKLEAKVRWDNSAENPRNPSQPPVMVEWGEESRDEMGALVFELVAVNEKDTAALQQALRAHTLLRLLGR